MNGSLKKKWLLIWKKGKKRFLLYISLTLTLIGVLTGLFLFRSEINKRAQAKFNLATHYYQEAQGNKDDQERLTKYQKARSLYEDVLSRYPRAEVRKETLFYLGNCLYLLGEYEETGKILREFCEKYEDDYFSSRARIKLGFAYEQQGRYKEAIQVYEEVLREYSDGASAPEALLGMARCWELENEWDEALSKYEELVSRYPLSNEAALGETRMQRLKGEGKVKD